MSDEAMLVWAVSISYRKVSYGPVLSSVNPSYFKGHKCYAFCAIGPGSVTQVLKAGSDSQRVVINLF